MSWQAYIDMMTSKETPAGYVYGCVEHAAIISLADGAIWANTPNFGLYGYSVDVPTEDGESTQPAEINEIDLFLYVAKNDGRSNSLAGIRISNEKYFKVQSDAQAGTIYLKKNGGGASIFLCSTIALFASWNGALNTSGAHVASQNPGLCNELVEKTGVYLKSQGY